MSASVELRNLAAVVPGTLDETIVLVAHRDNNGESRGSERQRERDRGARRARAPLRDGGTTESARTPLHTLVFLSTDGGAYGVAGRGALRGALAAGPARRRRRLARRPRRAPPGRGSSFTGSTATRRHRRSSRTATRRIASETGSARRRPAGVLTQLVSLALPFGVRRAGAAPRLGRARRSASRRPPTRARPPAATSSRGSTADGSDSSGAPRRRCSARSTRGRGADLDGRRGVPRRPRRSRLGAPAPAARGRPAVRRRRRSTSSRVAGSGDCRSRSAWRALRRARGASGSCSSSCSASPPWPARFRASRGCRRRPTSRPSTPGRSASQRSLLVAPRSSGCGARTRLVPRVRATPEEELAAYAVAFVALCSSARAHGARLPVRPAVRAPLALRVALASAASPRARPGSTDVVFGLGLIGPVLALVVARRAARPRRPRAALRRVARHDGRRSRGASTLAFAAWGAIAASSARSLRVATRRSAGRAADSEPARPRPARRRRAGRGRARRRRRRGRSCATPARARGGGPRRRPSTSSRARW